MSRLSVTSSNSLRRSSPSARKRARSLGRLGELAENETYHYEELNNRSDGAKIDGSSTYWQDRIRQVRSERGSPKLNGALQRAKSTCEVATDTVSPQRTEGMGKIGGQYAHSEGAGLRQRPTSFHYNKQTEEAKIRVHMRQKAAGAHLPDLLNTSRRPHSTYDYKVRTRTGICLKEIFGGRNFPKGTRDLLGTKKSDISSWVVNLPPN